MTEQEIVVPEIPQANYIFPKKVASMMAKVDMRTQYEASMMSMAFISIGIVLSVVYACIYLDVKLWFKIVTAVNGIFGIMFLGSSLVTTYQQYLSYMQGMMLGPIIAAAQNSETPIIIPDQPEIQNIETVIEEAQEKKEEKNKTTKKQKEVKKE